MRPQARCLGEGARAAARRLDEGVAEGNAVVAHRLLAAQGVAVSVRTVERAVRVLRQARRVAEVATVRVETAPGEQLQIDFGQKAVEIAAWTGERCESHCVANAGLSDRRSAAPD